MRVRRLGGSRAGEMRITRLLRNPKVSVDEIFATAAGRTAGLAAGRHVLAIQDTTSLRDDGSGHSLNLHAMIGVDAANLAVLGLLHARVLERHGGEAQSRKARLHADKQSHRWHEASTAAATLLGGGAGGAAGAGASAVTVVADREGDIYEDFALRPEGVHLLVRAAQDRALAEGGTLFGAMADLPELGRMSVELPAAPGRAARTAHLALRVRQVGIRRPANRVGDAARALPRAVPLTLVEARELDPPAGATPAHWRLLTSHRVPDLEQARYLCGLYRARWTTEQVFRTLKTQGFDVEALRIADPRPFQTLVAAALVAAISVMQMVNERDGIAGLPLAQAFMADDQPILEALSLTLEGKTQRQKNPHPKASLAFAAWVCARLGGWTGYYGKPGPIVIYNGLLQFNAVRRGHNIRKQV